VLHALGLFGVDETVRLLAPLLETWPEQGGNAGAAALRVAIRTDDILRHRHTFTQKMEFWPVRDRAVGTIGEMGAGLGLGEGLADRLVPRLGLDPRGSLVLDYGPRQFTVHLDEHLEPYVLDAAGTRHTDLPSPGATDDAESATAARQRFDALRDEARSFAADLIHRFERAMVCRRRWSAAEFRAVLVGHPVLVHLVRRLVWLADDGTTFRVAEDGTFTDATDERLTLREGATVLVAHPLHLGRSLPAWSELFAHHGIPQPFPQLGRDVYEPLPEDRDGTLMRFAGRTVSGVRLLALERRGWRRERPDDAGRHRHLRLVLNGNMIGLGRLPDGITATLGIEPGIVPGPVDDEAEQTVTALSISGIDDHIVVSEIIRDVDVATR
jgi:hypothetical protein